MKALPAVCRLLAATCLPLMAEQGSCARPPLTLDPELYADALREVQGLPAQKREAAPPQDQAAYDTSGEARGSREEMEDRLHPPSLPAELAEWQAAMDEAGSELSDVRLLVLLQRLNPLDPPGERADDYAAALYLHHLMLAGNRRACRELAEASRRGVLPGGLTFIKSEALAMMLEQRASALQLPRVAEPEPTARQEAEAQQGASS